jgi:hypothetical protein
MIDALLDYPREKIAKNEPLSSGEDIYQRALQLHDTFDAQVWKRQPSFHNKFHIESLRQAFTPLFEQRNESDPLDIRGNLDAWNQRHPQAQIHEDELPEVFTIAIACHDLGNIIDAESFTTHPDGQFNFKYLTEGYTEAHAEERSKIIAERLIQATTFPVEKESLGAKQARYTQFVKHIIDQTKYLKDPKTMDFPNDDSFRTITETLDQLGTHFFRTDSIQNPVKGLLLEKNAENLRDIEKKPETKPLIIGNPANFVNWVEIQFPKLVPDEEKRTEIIRIWGKSMPDHRSGFDPNVPLTSAEMLKHPSLAVTPLHK